jgi:hypothetical protein
MPRPGTGAQRLADERCTGQSHAKAGQDREQQHGYEHVCGSQLRGSDPADDPEHRDEAGGKEQLLQSCRRGNADEPRRLRACRQAAQKVAFRDMAIAKVKVNGSTDGHRDGAAHRGACHAQPGCAEIAENQDVVEQDVT